MLADKVTDYLDIPAGLYSCPIIADAIMSPGARSGRECPLMVFQPLRWVGVNYGWSTVEVAEVHLSDTGERHDRSRRGRIKRNASFSRVSAATFKVVEFSVTVIAAVVVIAP